ncbi:hypothetical protein FXW30_04145 [Candidatus Liberibacter asiaticus]|nr:hypothetical protein FXW22_04000 [Candidatus Liberibacter asiaticus]KAE9511327.1 hypothetical protein FXW31_02120 [Candidatus Liberibacter asiaticus]KAE9511985.1 hypothetical protein FXW32_03980 [Candidatus Liberibacter asiaticus]KAE9514183.1 hypothetical protein FXW25_03895 [Candidatus Liberibacter asiaticus]KAE9515232.1 hypothetical protein FXW26_03900 [Candidatus Liberibacter asiaticus]
MNYKMFLIFNKRVNLFLTLLLIILSMHRLSYKKTCEVLIIS